MEESDIPDQQRVIESVLSYDNSFTCELDKDMQFETEIFIPNDLANNLIIDHLKRPEPALKALINSFKNSGIIKTDAVCNVMIKCDRKNFVAEDNYS
jgi:hypothetical protein